MQFTVTANLSYQVDEPASLVLNIRALQYLHESLTVEPANIHQLDYPSQLNRLLALNMEEAGEISVSYSATAYNPYQLIDFTDLPPSPISQFGPDILYYLNPSRYCESDRLERFAGHQFGHIKSQFEQVMAIKEWIFLNVEYLTGSTNGRTTACDIITHQAGVCRDFAHVGIALCRALDIPARYCSVYAYDLQPKDFHACFEAYLSGYWIMFDATHLAPLNGFVKMATGLDAANTAISNLFGKIKGTSMVVDSKLTEGTMEPIYYFPGSTYGLSYL